MKHNLSPALLLVMIIGISIQISFNQSILINIMVILVSSIFLIIRHCDFKIILLATLFAIIPALGTAWSFIIFSKTNVIHNSVLYSSRIFAFLFLGMDIILTNKVKNILLSLSADIKLPDTFIYGIMTALNLINQVYTEYKRIKYAAYMRGKQLNFWQANLYLKIISSANELSDNYAQAITTQGFSEDAIRSHYQMTKAALWQWGFIIIVNILFAYLVFIIKPW